MARTDLRLRGIHRTLPERILLRGGAAGHGLPERQTGDERNSTDAPVLSEITARMS